MPWDFDMDEKLRQLWPVTKDKSSLEKIFGLKEGTIWLRAKSLGLTSKRKPNNNKPKIEKIKKITKKKWMSEDIERLYKLTTEKVPPRELMNAFPGLNLSDIIEEADRVSCDTCYLKNRETLMKSIDVMVNVNLDLDLNIRSVKVRCEG